MKILYNPEHIKHNPQFEVFDGKKETHQEIPSRLQNITQSLKQAGYNFVNTKRQISIDVLAKVHDYKYINFLKQISTDLNPRQAKYPSCWTNLSNLNSSNELAQIGFYSSDMYTPITQNIYEVAAKAATLAYLGAKSLSENEERIIYALTRPPGHHASISKMGGYCYFNNSAIAASYLSRFGKVAILDIDFHHGNGTQDIFYERDDVLTVSIHADPNWKFPYFKGFENETGLGKGRGFNKNFCLGKGTTDKEYLGVLELALEKIQSFSPKFLIIGFGTDTHEADPIGGFKLTTEFYRVIAQRINQLQLPTLINQEGGYATSVIGDNVVSFLQGFE